MKLTIERGALLKSLGHVQNVVERRNTIPILSNVLLEAGANTLGLTATDMDLTIVERAPASVGSGGAATVPAHTLYDIVRKLPEGSQVEIDGGAAMAGQAVVRAGRSKFALPTLPREDFPASSGGELPHRFTLPAKELRGLIDRSRFAISTEETRYYLNGIYLHVLEAKGGGSLRAVATDGHRLARVETSLPQGAAGMPGVIVPRKTVGELRKLIEETEEPIEVSLSDTRIRFAFDAVTLSSKLIDGNFPDYQRVIPTGNDKIMTVKRRRLRRGGGPGLHHRHGKIPGGQAQPEEGQHGALRLQPRERQRQRGARDRIRRPADGDRLQRPLPAGHRLPAPEQ